MARTAEAAVYTRNVMALLDINKDQIDSELMAIYGNEGKQYFFNRQLGYDAPVADTQFSWFEEDKALVAFKVGTKAEGSAGAINKYTITDTYVMPRVNDIVQFPNMVQGIVTKLDGTGGKDVSIKPIGKTATIKLPATTAGDSLRILTRAFGEGSGIGKPRLTRVSKKTNYTQIFKEKMSHTGTELTTQPWFEVDGSKGGMYNLGLRKLELAILSHQNGAFWEGIHDTNNYVDPLSEVGATVITTDGLLPSIASDGNDFGSVTGIFADYATFAENALSEFVPMDTPLWHAHGFQSFKKFEASLFSTFGSGNQQEYLAKSVNEKLFNGSNSFSAFVNYKYIQSNNYTFMNELIADWSNEEGGKIVNRDKTGIIVPMHRKADKKTGKMLGSITTRYKSYKGLDRRYKVADLNGFGTDTNQPINEVDLSSKVLMSDMGWEFVGLNSMGIYHV